MIMVKVKLKDGQEAVGLLINTHLVEMAGPPQMSMTPDKKLIQGPGQKGLQGFGVAAIEGGFIVGPLASMKPIFDPKEELGDDAPPGTTTGADEGEQAAPAEAVPAELRAGDGRKKKG